MIQFNMAECPVESKRVLGQQWLEVNMQRDAAEDSKYQAMNALLRHTVGLDTGDGFVEQVMNGQSIRLPKNSMALNQGLTPADAYREFDRISKIIMNPSGEFSTWNRVQSASRSVNLGRQVFEYRKVSADGEGAQISMSGQTGAKINHTSASYGGTIIPIIDKAYGRNFREIEAMRADGYDALIDDEREARLTIMRKANDLLWEGDSLSVKGKTWGGLRGDTNVVQETLTVDLVAEATTADEVYNAFRTMRDILRIQNNVASEMKVAVSRELMSKMETPFAVYDKGFGNILQMVKSLSGISEVYEDPKCAGSQLLFAHIGFDGLSCVTGMAMNSIAVPRTMYNDDYLFIKALAQGYIAKVDAADHKSVLYASN